MEARFAVLLVAALSGCSRSTPEAKNDTPDAAASATPAPAESVKLVQVDASTDMMSIVSEVKSRKDERYRQISLWEKLSVERQDRPANTLKADVLYDALNEKGIKITNRHQVLAQTVGAGYCLKADAEPDIDLTVCEFDSAVDVEKGKKAITSVPYPRREILTSKTSTVAIGRLGTTKATDDAADKIKAYLKTL